MRSWIASSQPTGNNKAMELPDRVKLVEVGPRDGLQNESPELSVATRIELINRLSGSGLSVIETGSFVSPRWVPQMASSTEVLAGITRKSDVCYPVLVPNLRRLEQALATGATDICVFAAASDTFSRRNLNCSIDDSLARYEAVAKAAGAAGVRVRGYVSCVLGCPYEGGVALETVTRIAEHLFGMGCHEISLGDTIGVGTPVKAQYLIDAVGRVVPRERLAAHFHDTYGQALANLLAVMQQGVAVIDSSVAGLGGCPYAPGAAGNVATEDVLFMLNGLGIETGVDLASIAETGRYICEALGRPPGSRVASALSAGKRIGRPTSPQS
jgi:hydroxymethylglutaryl-CoA lyase